MKNKNIILLLAVLLLTAGFLFIRQSSPKVIPVMEENEETQETVNLPAVTIDTKAMEENLESGATMAEDNLKTIEISASDFKFSPNKIEVNKEDKVRILFKNVQGSHDFAIDELEISIPQKKAGESAIIDFIADKSGTFEFYCSVGNHRQMGMVGKLIVK